MAALDALAQNNFGDTRSGSLAGPLGLLIIVLLAIGTALLIRNMNARLRRLPDRFPDQPGPHRIEPPGPGPDGEVPSAASGRGAPESAVKRPEQGGASEPRER